MVVYQGRGYAVWMVWWWCLSRYLAHPVDEDGAPLLVLGRREGNEGGQDEAADGLSAHVTNDGTQGDGLGKLNLQHTNHAQCRLIANTQACTTRCEYKYCCILSPCVQHTHTYLPDATKGQVHLLGLCMH